MSGLLGVERIHLPRALVTDAHRFLYWVGCDGAEGLALWAGVVSSDGREFFTQAIVIPEQHAVRGPSGVGVWVDGKELHRINRWLYERGMVLGGQIHSHPGSAFHSDTDDTFAVATTAGSVSLVVPDFASGPFDMARCAGFRLDSDGWWIQLSPDDLSALVVEGA
jgi:hypothetical protein